MSSVIGDADQIDALARTCQSSAAAISDIGDAAKRTIDSACWQGPKADRYRSAAGDRANRLHGESNELRDIAQALSAHAQWIRDRESQLRSIERRIRAWAHAHPLGWAPGQPDASLITWWPAPVHPDWERIAAILHRAGVVF
jgi:uncharacterized protein YukE